MNKKEALQKRKIHAVKDFTNMGTIPLCGLSVETTIREYGDLKLTGSKDQVTCRRCIRSLTGRY